MMDIASPQLENGHTKIANELLDAITFFNFSARQYRVLFTLIRKIYGFNKKKDDISGSQIGKHCGMQRPHVSEVLSQLAAMNVIFKEPGTFGTMIEINKNYLQWSEIGDDKKITEKRRINQSGAIEHKYHYTYKVTKISTGEFYYGVRSCSCNPNQDRYVGSGNWIATVKASELVKEILGIYESRDDAEKSEIDNIKAQVGNNLLMNKTVYGSTESVHGVHNVYRCTDYVQGVQKTDFASTESVQVDSTDSVHTKDNLPKDNHTKDKTFAQKLAQESFLKFYSAYPKKKSRAKAEKAFAKLAPDEQLLAEMISAIGRAKTSAQWQDPQMIPYPASWLNAQAWKDEIQLAFSDVERAVIQEFNKFLGEQLGVIDDNIFIERRAASIRTFLTLSNKENFPTAYFSYAAKKCQFPPRIGFDWIINSETFTKIKGGQYEAPGKQ